MSITDELRKWKGNINTRLLPETVLALRSELNCIADRIDAEHEEAIQQVLMGEGSVPATDENMAEYGWYRALCADRKPMLLGDRMEWANGTFIIHELKFTEGGCTTWDSEHGYTVHADECRHHHAPTVEDVLREFAAKVEPSWRVTELPNATLAEFAARLRLAGDGE